MYRGKIWTMRQFSGFGSPEDTNQRLHYLLKQGQTGLSIAFDLPTLMGYDSDHPLAEGEVGHCGVSVSSLADMETLLAGLPLQEVTTSMTINSPAAIIWAMYLVVAEKNGVDWKSISGTTQNDILKEYIAQKEYIFPPAPSMRLVVDTITFGAREVPRWNPISISGYHIREAGSTAVQELAFTLRDGIEYVEWVTRAGMPVDEFAPRLSFFFNAQGDLFEEVAKYRAARKGFGPTSCANGLERPIRVHAFCRFITFSQTAGCLAYGATALQQRRPHDPSGAGAACRRVGRHSIAAHKFCWTKPGRCRRKKPLRSPSARNRCRGARKRRDSDRRRSPRWFLLHRKVDAGNRAGLLRLFRENRCHGGHDPCAGVRVPLKKEIHDAAYAYQQAIERKEKIIVGVNDYVTEEDRQIALLVIDDSVERHQVKKAGGLFAEKAR